jgi:hypothetical protein
MALASPKTDGLAIPRGNARKTAKKNTKATENAIEKAGCSLWSSRL